LSEITVVSDGPFCHMSVHASKWLSYHNTIVITLIQEAIFYGRTDQTFIWSDRLKQDLVLMRKKNGFQCTY